MLDSLLTLFSASIEEERDRYVIEVPKREIETGDVSVAGLHRVAILDPPATNTSQTTPTSAHGAEKGGRASVNPKPVSEGDERRVEIESIGDQGDGIAKIEHGFVLIVDGANEGQIVDVVIEDVRDKYAFANVENVVKYSTAYPDR